MNVIRGIIWRDSVIKPYEYFCTLSIGRSVCESTLGRVSDKTLALTFEPIK